MGLTTLDSCFSVRVFYWKMREAWKKGGPGQALWVEGYGLSFRCFEGIRDCFAILYERPYCFWWSSWALRGSLTHVISIGIGIRWACGLTHLEFIFDWIRWACGLTHSKSIFNWIRWASQARVLEFLLNLTYCFSEEFVRSRGYSFWSWTPCGRFA